MILSYVFQLTSNPVPCTDTSWCGFSIQHGFFYLPEEAICKDKPGRNWGWFASVNSFGQFLFSCLFTPKGFFKILFLVLLWPVQVFREFYPTNEEVVTLECVWKSDKFVLLERMCKSNTGSPDGDLTEDASLGASTIKYQSVESFLGGKHFSWFSSDPQPPPHSRFLISFKTSFRCNCMFPTSFLWSKNVPLPSRVFYALCFAHSDVISFKIGSYFVEAIIKLWFFLLLIGWYVACLHNFSLAIPVWWTLMAFIAKEWLQLSESRWAE